MPRCWLIKNYYQKGVAMQKFELTPQMLSLSGAFYPKGYAFIMLPNAQDAELVAHEIEATQGDLANVMLLSSEDILRKIGKVDDADKADDLQLPSIGTEAATMHKYVALAKQGHCALMVKVDTEEETERVMTSVRKVPFSYGQRYHWLIIEDLV